MSLGDPITLSWNGANKTLVRTARDLPFGHEYFLDESAADGLRFTLTINHTVPKVVGAPGESHLVRLDVEQYSQPAGTLERVSSAWAVIKTFTGKQDSTLSNYTAGALSAFLDGPTITKVVARES
jgi:hypothetical protein